MAEILATAENPLVVMGDGVSDSGAAVALGALAERVGAEVWGANAAHINVAFDHPLFGGLLGHMFGESSRKVTVAADVVFVCGTYLFPEVYPLLSGVFKDGAKVIHIDLDPYQIAKNFPGHVGRSGRPAGDDLGGRPGGRASVRREARLTPGGGRPGGP